MTVVENDMFSTMRSTIRRKRLWAGPRASADGNNHRPHGRSDGLSTAPVESPLRAQGAPGAATGWRVLLVEDEASMRLLCRVNLGFAGIETVEAADGTQGVELATTGKFDLILLDVMLPDIGGFDVAERLGADERTRQTPIAFLSARADRADRRRGYQLGAVDYLTKPFDPVALAERVREILERVALGSIEAHRQAALAELED